ncbi:hypothetical protein NA57DRAFT_74236 [Rhizodiscina lignyota]|uniref:Inactive metallocarboxypeptidase ECM14 n=1 Tax=Rhizodiscina lignyota TaxID=1504668 RepID=A0A9P4IGL9_9PEZI|nr:hypothetical protein NA57DRAFT_74236 [Rhizodiscina lignyota]
MRLLSALPIALLSTLASHTLAIPYDSHCAPPAPWRRLSNLIIEKIWGLSPKASQLSADDTNRSRAGRKIPGDFLARYGHDVVLRFNISTAEEATSLSEAADVLFLDVWEFTEDWVDIRLAKDVVPSLLGLLPDSLQHAHAPLMHERALAQAIADSYPFPETPKQSTLPGAGHSHSHSTFSPSLRTSTQTENIFFTDYQPFSVIVPWMRLLASMFPTHVRMINIGITFEGRDIPALRVGVHPTNRDEPSGPRKTIIIAGGSHAREWISTTSVNYLAYNFITSYGKSASATSLLQAFDWVFIPTVNPDGYVYSWETDRLWRKNRQTTPLRFCRGLDLDRSWGFQWDGNATRENPCSESYAGEEPFEGVEAKRLAAWAKNETENNDVEIVGFLDLHSYSQQVLYPYSFSCATAPPTLENLEELALGLAKAMRLAPGGRFYQANSACEGNVAAANDKTAKARKTFLPRMETGGGSAIDWFYHELRVKYAYQIKLRDTGSYGFLLPKENIVPTGKEVVDAIYYLGRYMMDQVGFEADNTQLEKVSGLSMPTSEQEVLEQREDTPIEQEDAAPLNSENDESEIGVIHWDMRRRRR